MISIRKIVLVFLIVALSPASYFGYREYGRWRKEAAVRRANEAIESGDARTAYLALRGVWRIDEDNRSACVALIKILREAGSKEELLWRQRMIELEPARLEPRLALSSAAIRHGDLNLAGRALDEVPPPLREVAAYHSARGSLALARKDAEAALDFASSL